MASAFFVESWMVVVFLQTRCQGGFPVTVGGVEYSFRCLRGNSLSGSSERPLICTYQVFLLDKEGNSLALKWVSALLNSAWSNERTSFRFLFSCGRSCSASPRVISVTPECGDAGVGIAVPLQKPPHAVSLLPSPHRNQSGFKTNAAHSRASPFALAANIRVAVSKLCLSRSESRIDH